MAKYNFHGGCVCCLHQEKYGVDDCINCQYFEANWRLPSLAEYPVSEADLMRQKLKENRKKKEKYNKLLNRLISSVKELDEIIKAFLK